MKKIILIILFSGIATTLLADHLKGGWIFYEYLGPGTAANTSQYRISVNQYLNCNSNTNGQVDQIIYVSIYNNDNNLAAVPMLQLSLQTTDFERKTSFSPCITPHPDICYRVDKYQTIITLDNNDDGYTIAVQRCCRIKGIVNVANSGEVGVTYTNTIPGKVNGLPYYNDNSPVFAQKDTAVVCYNSPFTFDFSATDIDQDSLVYSFTSGITGGSSNPGGEKPNPPAGPPYGLVPYTNNFSGTSPMGSLVSIDPQTGIISGRAPSQTGDYVVAVLANEYRNGVLIGSTRKEIHITVANCSVSAATLKPEYISCNSFTNTFFNESTNAGITSYLWDFGVENITTDTSQGPTPTYTYQDTGVYVVKLTVVAGTGCVDSAATKIKVYPGFVPNFRVNGSCFLNNYTFTDATTTAYGVVDNWSWSFGDVTTLADTSHIQNPVYKYPAPAPVTVQLVVTNSKGCIDTATQTLTVLDKPLITLPFRDTLICSIDTLQLRAIGTGIFAWTPTTYMLSASTSTPLVFPKDTTTYIVSLNDKGCVNTDSIVVNVLDAISVQLPTDTTICQTDSIMLQPVSHGLQYTWTPATGLSSPTVKYPNAAPPNDITYFVEARLGKCKANTSTRVLVVPYPEVVATGDTTICFAATRQLHATTNGSSFHWGPTNSMLYSNTLNPIAGPQATTAYWISVTDTLGCPKPSTDTVLITVIPRVKAFAGNDTSVVAGQPLQLQATGGTNYLWTPLTGLTGRTLSNPLVVMDGSIDSIVYTVRVSTREGCFADDNIKVRIYKTSPEIFVPSGFTPNADGRNDILRPILAGMKKLVYFRVYNRWGQLLYSTSQEGQGWDGSYKEVDQASGTYIYVAQAIDYTGKTVTRKGSSVLIR